MRPLQGHRAYPRQVRPPIPIIVTAELTKGYRYSEQFTNAHFVKVDVDDVPDVAQELGVRAMPTFILFKGGEKAAEVVGMNPPALLAAIEKLAGPSVAA